jgi:hypothetical protein
MIEPTLTKLRGNALAALAMLAAVTATTVFFHMVLL